MNFEKITIEESHPSVNMKQDTGFKYVLLVGKRDENKRVMVPLLFFGPDGKFVGNDMEFKSASTDTKHYEIPEKRCDDLRESLRLAAPESSYLYEIRVGSGIGLICTDREMKPATVRES
jgi:hypothetical protein